MIEYLIGIGAQKAGTTLFYELLSNHHGIDLGIKKEKHYFDKHTDVSLVEYNKLFSCNGLLKLDITPSYMFLTDCLDKIKRTLPSDMTKVFLVLRDPIKRAESHFYMARRNGNEKRAFINSFCSEKESLRNNNIIKNSYFKRGLYYDQVKKAYDLFGKENVRVYIFEEVIKNQQKTIDDICDFAGLDKIEVKSIHSGKGYDTKIKIFHRLCLRKLHHIEPFIPNALCTYIHKINKKYNRKELIKEDMPVDFYNKLKDFYQDDVKKLEKIINKDLSFWMNENEKIENIQV